MYVFPLWFALVNLSAIVNTIEVILNIWEDKNWTPFSQNLGTRYSKGWQRYGQITLYIKLYSLESDFSSEESGDSYQETDEDARRLA